MATPAPRCSRRPPAPAHPRAAAVGRNWQLGADVYYVGGTILEITPPLLITDEQVDRAMELLGTAIADAVAGVVRDADVAPNVGW